MRTLNVARIAAAAALLVLAAGAWAQGGVKVANGKDGAYLTDAKGMALYTFKKDTPGKSACAGDCITKWPLFHEEKVGAPGGLKESDFATITRADGQKQTTYKGMPLYFFVGDQGPGDTNGQGVAGVWSLAKP